MVVGTKRERHQRFRVLRKTLRLKDNKEGLPGTSRCPSCVPGVKRSFQVFLLPTTTVDNRKVVLDKNKESYKRVDPS